MLREVSQTDSEQSESDFDLEYIAGPNFRYKCNGRGMCERESDGAWGGDLSFEVLKHGGLHLVVTEVVPVSGGVDKRRVFVLFSI